MSSTEFSRRQVLSYLLIASSGAAVLAGCTGRSAALCHDMANADDKPLRASLGYTENSPDADKQCRHCSFFTGGEGSCGQCTIFNGPVNANGHCSSWSLRPA